jgi:hypothetical protein
MPPALDRDRLRVVVAGDFAIHVVDHNLRVVDGGLVGAHRLVQCAPLVADGRQCKQLLLPLINDQLEKLHVIGEVSKLGLLKLDFER